MAIAAGERSCGSCSLCCKLLGIAALDKAAGSWCSHCAPPLGCSIYDSRPGECRTFSCVWLESAVLGSEWWPARSKMVLYLIDDGTRLMVHVDPGSPGVWQQSPYHAQLRAWAGRSLRIGGPTVVVRIGERLIAVLPDEDVDLGRVFRGDSVFIGERLVAGRLKVVAEVVRPGVGAAGSDRD